MNKWHKETYENIRRMESNARYELFISKVIDDEQVWLLTEDDSILSLESEDGVLVTPVWAFAEMAEKNRKGLFEGSVVDSQDLNFFLSEMLDTSIKNKDIIAPNFDLDSEEYDDSWGQRIMRKTLRSEIRKKRKWYREHDKFDRIDDPGSEYQDYGETLKSIQKSFKKSDDSQYNYDPPYWLMSSDPLMAFFNGEREIIRRNGHIVFGYILKCTDDLFDRYPMEDGTALVLYSEESDFMDDPERLRAVGYKISELSGRDIIPSSLKDIMSAVDDENSRVMNRPLPEEVTGEKGITLTTVVIHKDHLQNGMLFRRIIPLGVLPEGCQTCTVIPYRFWPTQYQSFYTSFNEVDISHKFEPRQNKEIIRTNDAVLALNEDEKYTNFIETAAKKKQVWTLSESGSPAVIENESGKIFFLIWPTEELAIMNMTDELKDNLPMSISVYEFIAKWLPNTAKLDYGMILFYYRGDGLETDVAKLRRDLEKEVLATE